MKCQSTAIGNKRCNKPAIWKVGPDWYGFGAKKDARVCDNWVCRSWAANGSAVGFTRILK